ncbi:MAG: trypsin-like peptidase domain-containing protein, partial [Deltaproteobacteria bacterium]|nr:trypsin-like peptidase domain-containing protein [Deltaproteobacteria bacterium]
MRSGNGKPQGAARAGVQRAYSILLAISLITAGSGAPPQPATAQGGASLGQLDRSLRTLSENVNEAVVQVVARGLSPCALGPDDVVTTAGRQVGSGVFVSKEGLLITNAHVVVGASSIEVVASAGRSQQKARRSILGSPPKSYLARIVGIDLETDLALLKVDAVTPLFLRFGDSDRLALGQVVLAFGSPLGLGGSVSMGVVSARARQLEPESPMVFIQTDAAINPGSSGGPLVDLQGRIVGINTLIVTQSGGNVGLGFAIPSNSVHTVYEQLRDDGVVTRGIIGA